MYTRTTIILNKVYDFITHLVGSTFKKKKNEGKTPIAWLSMVTSLMELMREVLVTLSRFCIFDLKSHTFFSSTVPARATKFYSSALSLTQAFSWPNSVLVPFCVLSKQPLLGLKQTCGIEITSILPKVAYFSFFLDPFLIPLLPTPSSYQFFLSLGSSYL